MCTLHLIHCYPGTVRNPAEQCTLGIPERVAGLNLPSFVETDCTWECSMMCSLLYLALQLEVQACPLQHSSERVRMTKLLTLYVLCTKMCIYSYRQVLSVCDTHCCHRAILATSLLCCPTMPKQALQKLSQ